MPLKYLENNDNNVSSPSPRFHWSIWLLSLSLCIHSSNSDPLLYATGQTSSFLSMARFSFLVIAFLAFAVGKPEDFFPSGPEPGVLSQQLDSTSGAGSLPLFIPDGELPGSGLQDFDGNAISLQDPSTAESAIAENSLNPSSALIASTPKSCSSPASKLRKRQNPLQLIWGGIQDLPFMNFLKPTPEDHSFCPISPDVLTGGPGSSAPKPGRKPQNAPNPKPGAVGSQPKKGAQERPQDEPEPMASGPRGPSCPEDYPQKVCCRGDLTTQLLVGFAAVFDECWDCELLQLTWWTYFLQNAFELTKRYLLYLVNFNLRVLCRTAINVWCCKSYAPDTVSASEEKEIDLRSANEYYRKMAGRSQELFSTGLPSLWSANTITSGTYVKGKWWGRVQKRPGYCNIL